MPMPCGCRRPCCSADCWCPPSARRRCLPTLPGCALPCRPRIARTMSRNSSRRCMRSPKPVLVLLHGWGMNGRVFDTLAARLADAFEVRAPHLPGSLTKIKTTGDKILDVPLAKVGGKGLFTKELEVELLAGSVDLCVHSMKDVPTELPDGCTIAAMPERVDPRDAIVSGESGY